MMSGPASGRSPARSRKGSHAGSYVGSHAGSHVGSHSGSHVGSHPGSHVGSQSTVSCQVLLRHSLAITLRRTGSVPGPLCDAVDNDFWMYDNGYLLFQGFVEANARCFWSAALLEAMRELSFEGYVSPGVLLVRAGACALDVVRAAWGRRVLKPPPNYVIADVGDIEDCLVVAVPQSQFTPLPEALCWVILELTSTGQAAVLPAILRALPRAFPAMTQPEAEVVYDALAKLSTDRKVYQTARGYFLVTPETRRRLASMQSPGSAAAQRRGRRSMLLSNEEALVMVHGDMQTERDGHRTHQCVQTNLADVICGGNPEDKVLYARDRSVEDRVLERRHSLRLSTRLGQALQRAGSLRSLPPRPPPTPPSTPATPPGPEKKQSLLARLFRRSGRPRGPRGRRGQSAPPGHSASARSHSPAGGPQIRTFSAQFPNDDDDVERHPADWFNPGVTSLTSVATQTQPAASSASSAHSSPAVARWASPGVLRASTLPRSLSRGSPRRARRLSDSLGLSVSRAASPATPTASSMAPASLCPSPSPSLCPSLSPSKCAGKLQTVRKTSPSNTLLSCASSRASRASASTSGMSKASSGYNSSGTRSGSPTTSATTATTTAGTRRSLPTPTKSPFTSPGSAPGRNSTTTTATINGGNTKIYVQQHNAPVRSVITIENRSSGEHTVVTRRGGVLETSFDRAVPKSSSSAASGGGGAPVLDVVTTLAPAASPGAAAASDAEYSHNKINNHNLSGKLHPATSSSSSTASSEESLTSAGSLVTKEAKEAAEMNNIRKLSLTAPAPGFLRESLSYKNILKEVQNYTGGPAQQQAQSGSPYASLSDLSVHCKSLAAQRILSGVSINSIDTLVEVNMAASVASGLAADKKTNCDVTIRTDFGMV